MVELMAMLVGVSVAPGPDKPEIEIIPGLLQSIQECEQAVERINRFPTNDLRKYDTKGRPVVMNHYQCLLVDVGDYRQSIEEKLAKEK